MISFFNAFLTDDEHSELQDVDLKNKKKRKLLHRISRLILLYFKSVFEGAEKIPNILSDDTTDMIFRPSTLQNLQSSLKRQGLKPVIPDPSSFHKFRDEQILLMRKQKEVEETNKGKDI